MTILNTIRFGDRITIVNRFGQKHTGRATLRGSHGWVLDMGGKHGTPAVATDDNIVAVKHAHRRCRACEAGERHLACRWGD